MSRIDTYSSRTYRVNYGHAKEPAKLWYRAFFLSEVEDNAHVESP